MSGRGGRGRGRARGNMTGRGRGQGQRTGRSINNKPSSMTTIKTKMSEHIYHIGSDRQGSDFVVNTRFILNHIQGQFVYGEDIATALENRVELDFKALEPRKTRSKVEDEDARRDEDESMDAIFKAEVASFVKRKETYKSNKGKAYATLWRQCQLALQNKIQNRHDFDTKIKNDPIRLLKSIEELSLSYDENRYEMATIIDAIRSLVSIRQKEGEELSSYETRFRNLRDITVAQLGGEIILHKIIGSGADINGKAQKEAWEKMMAYLFLERVLKERYGSLLTALKQQHSFKQDQYPTTLEEAVQMLNAHDWDNRKINPNKSKQNNNDKKKSDTEISNKTEAITYQSTIMSGLTFAQMEGSCYCCGKRGHLYSRCPEKANLNRNGLLTRPKRSYMLSKS